MSVIIVEGVTGSGKTSTIKALRSLVTFQHFGEEATFNGFMRDFAADPELAARRARDRMATVLDAVETANDSQRYVFERFHFSQLALGSDWKWYKPLDERCATLDCKVVALTVPDDQLASRSLYRAEYGDTDWQGLVEHAGSEQGALKRIRRAQESRLDAIRMSRLEHLIIDTTAGDWIRYACEIADWGAWLAE